MVEPEPAGLPSRPVSGPGPVSDKPAPPQSPERGLTREEAALFARLRAGHGQAREELVRRHRRLALSVALRFKGRADPEELGQVALLGLLKAIDRFDPTRGTAFSTYAVPLILGEVRHYLRSLHPVRVSRSVQDLGHRALAAAQSLEHRLGRSPTPAEVAGELGVGPEEVVLALEAFRPVLSLDALEEPGGASPVGAALELPGSGAALQPISPPADARLERLALRQALASIGEADRRLVHLRFVLGTSQEEAARQLGVSQATVSRRERQVLAALRRALGP